MSAGEAEAPHRIPGTAEVAPERQALGARRERTEGRGELGQQGPGFGWRDLVLDRDVWRDLRGILRGQPVAPFARKFGAERDKPGRREGEGDTAAERAVAGRVQPDGRLAAAERVELGRDPRRISARQGVEERQMGRNDIALGREMPSPESVETPEGRVVQPNGQDQRRGTEGLRAGGAEAQNLSASRASLSWAIMASAASRAL